MRTLTQPAAANAQFAQEPVVLLKIQLGGLFYYYADRDIGYQGRIMSFSGISSQKNVSNVAAVTSCSFVLSDHDGVLKNLMDRTGLEGAQATVSVFFAYESGVPTELFWGRVTNPNWQEGDRTLEFEVISEIEAKEVGFSVSEGEFGVTNDVAIGKPWPVVFGTAAHVPATLVQTVPEDKLAEPVRIMGQSPLEERYQVSVPAQDEVRAALGRDFNVSSLNTFTDRYIYLEDCKSFPKDEKIYLEIDGVIFYGFFTTAPEEDEFAPWLQFARFKIIEANANKWENISFAARVTGDRDEHNPKVAWLDSNNIDLTGHHIYIKYTHRVWNPDLEAYVDSVSSTVGLGDYSTNFCTRQEGRKCWFEYPFMSAKTPGAAAISDDYALPTDRTKIAFVKALGPGGLRVPIHEFQKEIAEKLKQRHAARKKAKRRTPFGPLLKQLELLKYCQNAYWSAPSGTVVRQWRPAQGDIYVANMLESTRVLAVYGKRKNINGVELFDVIPKSYYTINTQRSTALDDGPQTCTTIEFNRPLASFKEQNWDTDVYVTLESTVGPNVSDVIKWILENYTDCTIDSSFSDLRTLLSKYPVNFAVLELKDALELCQDIASQARCGLIYDSGIAKLRYLSAAPTPVHTLTEAKTEFQSMSITCTPVDDIYTVFRGKWQEDYQPEDKRYPKTTGERDITFRANVNTYGTRKTDVDYTIYNTAALVRQSMRFWGNRQSRSWTLVKLRTFLSGLLLEVFDAVTLDYTTGLLAGKANIGIVESVTHNIHDASVDLTLWVPTVFGETGTSEFAWQSDAFVTPPNPATKYDESDMNLAEAKELDDVAEIIREIHKLDGNTKVLAKITQTFPDNSAKIKVDYYGNGLFERPTKKNKTAYLLNPYEMNAVGDWVVIETGQDGMHHALRYEIPPILGMILESTEDNKYKVQLLHTSEEPGSWSYVEDDLPDWALKYNLDRADSFEDAEKQEIDAINISECGNPDIAGTLQPGTFVTVRYTRSIIEGESSTENGYWYFEASTSGSNAAFGKIVTKWDPNVAPNYVMVYPCDQSGDNPQTETPVKVYIGWPDAAKVGDPSLTVKLNQNQVISYMPLGLDSESNPIGAAFYLWRTTLWGKAVTDFVENQNWVNVRLCTVDGAEIGFTNNVKCYLFSPHGLTPKGVQLQANDLISLQIVGEEGGNPIAHALNVYGAGANKLLDGTNHTDTENKTPVKGGLIISKVADVWTMLDPPAEPTGYEVLSMDDQKNVDWVDGRIDLLDGAWHQDTVLNVVAEGDLIIGNSSVPSKWDVLSIGAENSVMCVDDSQPYWYGPPAGPIVVTPLVYSTENGLHWNIDSVTADVGYVSDFEIITTGDSTYQNILQLDRKQFDVQHGLIQDDTAQTGDFVYIPPTGDDADGGLMFWEVGPPQGWKYLAAPTAASVLGWDPTNGLHWRALGGTYKTVYQQSDGTLLGDYLRSSS